MKAIKPEILICPNCRNNELNINYSLSRISCSFCNKEYVINKNKIYFIEYAENEEFDFLNKIKSKFKKYSNFYKFVIKIISPVYFNNNHLKSFIKNFINDDIVAINIGSGNTDLHNKITNIDMFKYDNVDMTADLLNLPIKENSIDIIINIAVLEHVPFPDAAIKDFFRILKKGGMMYCYFPFIQGFHASPNDFSRRTIEGLKVLCKDFDILEIKDVTGPTSGFLWVFQEYLAILLSFGIKQLYFFLLFLIMILTFPIKFLDILLVKHSMAKNISSGFVVIAKKDSIEI